VDENMITPATFSDVFELLERSNVRYVVVSGVAVVLHGHVRPLADLDIVIGAVPGEQERAVQTLMMAGFLPSIPVPLAMLTVLRMFDQSEREIDVFRNYHVPFPELWANSDLIGVGAGTARIASLDHLLRAKRTTGRPHDLEDIEALMLLQSSAH
jgi:hypothetical protein